ncbi:ribosome hibernation-promoting factor, HPF/YfiA family [Jejuia spongiicola]|uniref:Ribosome-associated translation inhibitor RaiA n=1 Tax=Jejuia spongiicola TaxID=2942207 RepID=A0ABT0QHV2_9FLAO|nr:MULTISPECIES: ribosome-associated translation inhibitor RaiA [Flavobacteriaceae]MCL6296465.1 ribosome-associated translation inhibitor RaiA [Jejuia spongiicola]PIA82216.1 ribosomal subunit interface protein [Gaetbulibacter sp. 4G1]
MTINIQYVHIGTSETMSAYVTDKLERLHKKYDWIIKAEVHFQVEHNAKEKGKICKIELSVPGPRIFASSDEDNYEDAVKRTIKDLEIQLKKRKQVFNPH